MKSVRHNTVYLVGANSLQVAIGLMLSIFLARYFDQKAIYGKYQQLFVIINFLVAFSSGIPMGLAYFYGRYLDFSSRIRIYKRFGWSMIFFALFLGLLVSFFNGFLETIFQNSYFNEYLLLFSALLFLKILNAYFLQFNLTRGKLPYYFTVIFLELVATILLIIVIYRLNLQVREILMGLLVLSLVKFMFLGANALMYFRVNGPVLLLRQEFNYILPMTAISLASILTVYTDKFMISTMLDPKSFAEYQVGAFSIPFIGIITGSVVTALIPALSRLKSEGKIAEIVGQMLNATKKTSLFLLPILVYCVILGKYLITVLYSETYESSGYIFQLYTASYLLSVLAFSAVMNAIGLQRWVLLNTLINLVLNIILNLILIPKYGTYGAVYATLGSTYLGYFLPIFLLKKHMSASFLAYFPLKFYIKILVLSIALAGLVLWSIEAFDLNKWVAVLTALPFYAVIVGIGMEKNTLKINLVNILKKVIGSR